MCAVALSPYVLLSLYRGDVCCMNDFLVTCFSVANYINYFIFVFSFTSFTRAHLAIGLRAVKFTEINKK
jgi:hypothetical protein